MSIGKVLQHDDVVRWLSLRDDGCDVLRRFMSEWKSVGCLAWLFAVPDGIYIYLDELDEFGSLFGDEEVVLVPLWEDPTQPVCIVAVERAAELEFWWVDLYSQSDAELIGRSCASVVAYAAYDAFSYGLSDDEDALVRRFFDDIGFSLVQEVVERIGRPDTRKRTAVLAWTRSL